MATEREVKLGIRETTCSITGKRCKCDSGDSCAMYRQGVDNLSTALVSRLRTLRLHVGVALDDCEWICDYDSFERTYPQPEVRDIARKLRAITASLDEILSKGRCR